MDPPSSPDGHAAQMFRSDGTPERRRVRVFASFEVREKFGGFDGGGIGKISRRRREVQRRDGEKTRRRARHVGKKTRRAIGRERVSVARVLILVQNEGGFRVWFGVRQRHGFGPRAFP